MTIRNKLTYKFLIIVASLLLFFSLAIFFFTNHYRKQQFERRLIDKGLTTAKLLLEVDEVDANMLKIIDRNNLTVLSNEKVTVYDEGMHEIYNSDEEPRIPVAGEIMQNILSENRYFFNYGKDEAVGMLYNNLGKNYIIVVSAYDTYGWYKISHLKNLLIGSNIVTIIIIYLAGWIFSKEALHPISRIVNEVNAISANNLHQRLSEGNRQDELAQLAITFNKMLERLNIAFQTQKSFVSNASHELRTPLTSIKAQLQVALMNERKKVQYRNILESVLQDVDGMVNLSNGLLKIAQAGNELSRQNIKPVRIDELLLTSIGEMNRKFINQSINFNLEYLPADDMELVIQGDEQLLKTALTNIVENACKYSSGNMVTINVELNKNKIIIGVSDKGVGIKNEELKFIFDPFFRGSNVRQISGNGIGLPLTKSIVQMHNGDISILSVEGSGTTVTLSFLRE